MTTVTKKPAAIKSALQFAKGYFFTSNERFSALLLLLGILLSVAALVALNAVFAWWIVGFWSAITAMSYPLYLQSIQYFFVIVAGYISVSVIKDYLVQVLTLRWRNWFTQQLLEKYTALEGNNYLELSRHANQIDNPAQRIQEDVQTFVTQTLLLTTDLLRSILTQIAFIGTLWVVGGALSFVVFGATVTIPGYLVWVAILFALTSSVLTHWIGGSLAKLTNQQKGLEADFRKEMETMNHDAESIAQDHGADYYKQSLVGKFQAICRNTYDTIRVRVNVTAFNSFYQQLASIFPYMVAAPLYFAQKTTLGQLMQIGLSFGNIQEALSWFTNSYETLAVYRASVLRITELDRAMESQGLNAAPRAIIQRDVVEAERGLRVDQLSLTPPSSTEYMMRELTLEFKRGEHTLIKGVSGMGKSTLFKAIAGTWTYGQGEISVSKAQTLCFLPQKPSLPNVTLKGILAYPDSVDTYTDEEYEDVLHQVGDLEELIKELPLEKKDFWSRRLSPGQQQRISFARGLLKKPDWLFLDEATASLDTETEERLYSLVREKLQKTTMISIAHRPTVEGFHDRVVTLKVDADRMVRVESLVQKSVSMKLALS